MRELAGRNEPAGLPYWHEMQQGPSFSMKQRPETTWTAEDCSGANPRPSAIITTLRKGRLTAVTDPADYLTSGPFFGLSTPVRPQQYFAGQRVGQWTDRTGSVRHTSGVKRDFYPYGEEVNASSDHGYKFADTYAFGDTNPSAWKLEQRADWTGSITYWDGSFERLNGGREDIMDQRARINGPGYEYWLDAPGLHAARSVTTAFLRMRLRTKATHKRTGVTCVLDWTMTLEVQLGQELTTKVELGR
jgi:hypothetical protein